MGFRRNEVYVSATRVKTFLECKYKFKLYYLVKQPPSDEPPPFVFGPGNTVHKLAQNYCLDKKDRTEEERKKEIIGWMETNNLDDSYYYNIEQQYDIVIDYLTPYLEDREADKAKVIMESKLNTHWFDKYWFFGFIDLKVDYGDKVIITDYKSSKSESDHDLQLAIYAYGTAKAMKKKFNQIECHILYTKLNKLIKRQFTADEVKEKLIHVSNIIKQSESETEWVKQPNKFCDFCQYKSFCKPNG